MEEFQSTVEIKEDIKWITLSGVADAASAINFGVWINQIIEPNYKKYIFKAKDITYLNSHSIGVLVSAVKKITQNEGKIAFLSPSDVFRHIVELSGLQTLITFFDEEKQALDYVNN